MRSMLISSPDSPVEQGSCAECSGQAFGPLAGYPGGEPETSEADHWEAEDFESEPGYHFYTSVHFYYPLLNGGAIDRQQEVRPEDPLYIVSSVQHGRCRGNPKCNAIRDQTGCQPAATWTNRDDLAIRLHIFLSGLRTSGRQVPR